MRKYALIFLTALPIGVAFCQSSTAGRLKISIDKITCVEKCWDGVVEFDGHGNEISVTYAYRIYNAANPNAARPGTDGTVIYGSNINGMTRAGTQTPDLGGIKEGDVVNISKPIMDEHVNADDYIVIAPTVWEWDGPEKSTINSFNSQLDDDLFWVTHQPFLFANTPVKYTDPFADRVINASKFPAYNGGSSKYKDIFKNFLCPFMREGNRPVGIVSGTYDNDCKVYYLPNLVMLDTRSLHGLYLNNKNAEPIGFSHAEKESRTNFISGLDVHFYESNHNFPYSYGNYTVSLKIEFIPDPIAPVTPPAATTFVSKNLPVKNIGMPNSPVSVAGNWIGTQTNDNGLYPQSFGFELTASGEIIMKTQNGTVAAKGNFTIANNVITGWYKLFASNETFSLSALYDPATVKISGTLGSGAAITGQGKWVVTKK